MFKDLSVYTDEYKNGFQLSSMGAVLTRDSTVDLIPPRDIGTKQILGRPGSVKTSTTIKNRNINLSIHYTTEDLSTFNPFKYFSIDELDEFLTRLFVNNHKEFEIELSELPGRFYKCYLDAQGSSKIYLSDGDVSFNLVCYDPYIYGDLEIIKLDQDSLDPDNPVFIDCSLCTADTYLNLKVSGDKLGIFGIKLGDSDPEFNYVNPLYETLEDEYVFLNSYDRTLRSSSGTNLLPVYDGHFPVIPKGSRARIASMDPIEVSYRKRYLF